MIFTRSEPDRPLSCAIVYRCRFSVQKTLGGLVLIAPIELSSELERAPGGVPLSP